MRYYASSHRAYENMLCFFEIWFYFIFFGEFSDFCFWIISFDQYYFSYLKRFECALVFGSRTRLLWEFPRDGTFGGAFQRALAPSKACRSRAHNPISMTVGGVHPFHRGSQQSLSVSASHKRVCDYIFLVCVNWGPKRTAVSEAGPSASCLRHAQVRSSRCPAKRQAPRQRVWVPTVYILCSKVNCFQFHFTKLLDYQVLHFGPRVFFWRTILAQWVQKR